MLSADRPKDSGWIAAPKQVESVRLPMDMQVTHPWEITMTLEQHYAAAREIWAICEATRRLWQLTGDVHGPFRPFGPALGKVRRLQARLQKRFRTDFPGQHDPYRDIEC